MAFGKEIKRLRDSSNISAQAFADAIGISAERLRKWEQRDLNPRHEDTELIEGYFGMTLQEISRLKRLPSMVQKVPHETNHNLISDSETPGSYLERRRRQMFEAKKEVWFPVYQGNTRLREDGELIVYNDEPEMQVPIGFLPQNMYPGCNHGERVFGNSMYPRIANQGYVAGRIIDKTKIVFGELYGLHLTGNNPAVVKYIHPCDDDSRCVLLVSERRDIIKDQKISIDDVTMIFRVLFIINPA